MIWWLAVAAMGFNMLKAAYRCFCYKHNCKINNRLHPRRVYWLGELFSIRMLLKFFIFILLLLFSFWLYYFFNTNTNEPAIQRQMLNRPHLLARYFHNSTSILLVSIFLFLSYTKLDGDLAKYIFNMIMTQPYRWHRSLVIAVLMQKNVNTNLWLIC